MTIVKTFVANLQAKGRRLYHFTDSRNIANIASAGLLATKIAKSKGLIFATGGDEASLGIDQHKGFDDYVRLSFCPSHPMAHIARERGSIVKVRVLNICPSVMLGAGVVVSDQVATANGAVIGTPAELLPRFDLIAAYEYLDWKVSENKARRDAAERWEVMVPTNVPIALIRGL